MTGLTLTPATPQSLSLLANGAATFKAARRSIFDLSTFDTYSDGTTDDTDAIQAAFDAAHQANGNILVPAGLTFSIAGSITGYANVGIQGGGTLQFADIAGQTVGITINNQTWAVTVAITADTVIGSRSITVNATTGIAAGDHVFLSDSHDVGGGSGNGTFITRVTSVTSSTVLLLDEALPLVLYAASSAQLQKFANGLATISYSDFNVVCGTPGVVPTYRVKGMWLIGCQGRVQNVSFDGGAQGIDASTCRGLTVAGCSFDRFNVTSASAINTESSTAVAFRGNTVRRSATAIAVFHSSYCAVQNNILQGSSNDFKGRGIKVEFVSPHTVVTGNQVTDFGFSGIYVAESPHCLIGHNNVARITDPDATSARGILLYDSTSLNHHNVVSGNKISYTQGSGILDFSDAAGTSTDNVIVGNNLTSVAIGPNPDDAIFVNVSGTIITGNTIDTYGSGIAAIRVYGSTTTKAVIAGNLIDGPGIGIDTASSAGGNKISGNTINAAGGNTLHQGDETDITETHTFTDSGHYDFWPAGGYAVGSGGLWIAQATAVGAGAAIYLGTCMFLVSADSGSTNRCITILSSAYPSVNGYAAAFSVQNDNSTSATLRTLTAAATGNTVTVAYARAQVG